MFTLSAAWAALTLAGILCHLVADWFFQNDWMAKNKSDPWHIAGWVHAGIHASILLLVFPVWAALLVGIIHWVIDLRSPLDWWGKFSRQTRHDPNVEFPVMDIGMEVAFWRDQVAHFVVIALVALFV
jgi:hypothetical protein